LVAEGVRKGDQGVAGDIERAEHGGSWCLVKRLHSLAIVGKGDRVEQAVELVPALGYVAGQLVYLRLVLYVAHQDIVTGAK
jgi:hypothetical protein